MYLRYRWLMAKLRGGRGLSQTLCSQVSGERIVVKVDSLPHTNKVSQFYFCPSVTGVNFFFLLKSHYLT